MPSDIFLKVEIQQQNKMIELNLIENALLEDCDMAPDISAFH